MRPTPRSTSRVTLAAVFGLALLAALAYLAWSVHEFDRFEHHAAVADARIVDSDLGCIGALGSASSTSSGWSGSIRYDVEFPYRGGTHATSVVRPCDVIPPDFGRGRGFIWVEYDRDHPDRVRVLNDDTARGRVRFAWEGVVTVCAAAGVIALAVRDRRLRTRCSG